MDADGSGFSFSSTTDYPKGQDTTDISWADIFLDGIHSDDPITSESGNISTDTSSLGAGMHGNAQQMHHQSQSSIMAGQLQIHIPTQLQGSISNNAVQQGVAKMCGTVTYIGPSGATQQHVNSAGQIQNMMTVGGHHQVGASLGQQQQQNSAKLVQIAPSFPVTSLGNTLPLQTLLQSGQNLSGQTLYGGQGGGLFPSQGSVHIENPKVVNVNFGPHVIGSDGSGQQAIIQTAEGKRVLITNSQLQHMPQSISLTQPLMGTQLINTGGGNLIRASLAPGTHTIMPSGATSSRQIVLPSGHTMTNAGAGGITKNVVLRQLNPNMSSVIYQSGQGGQLIHSQPTLISSGSGLQVVNTGGSHGNQVQLIAQPSINQTGMGQQQGTVMNLINNSGNGNQITGLVPGQNIFVNGQVLSIGQLGSLAVPQLQMQQNSQGGMTLTDINSAQFQSSAPHLVIQQTGQGQQIVLQPKNNPSPSFMTNVLSHRFISGLPGSKTARTPTPNASSASSTPVMTPTPSTPTPTPTPELISDFTGGKSSQSIDIFKQALDMSDIDLQSFGDDISFLDEAADCFSSITPQPNMQTPVPSSVKPIIKPVKSKSKPRSKSKVVQPIVNVSVHNSILPIQQSTQEQNLTLNAQQKIVTAGGQVYVLSGNNFVLQPSASLASQITHQITPVSSITSTASSTNRAQMSVSPNYHFETKGQIQQGMNHASFNSLSLPGQIKVEPNSLPVSLGQNSVLSFAETDSKAFFKASPGSCSNFTVVSSAPSSTVSYNAFTTTVGFFSSPAATSPSSAEFNLQLKNHKISTLGGTFVKHKPITSVIKQENISEFNQPVSNNQSFTPPAANIQSFNQAVSGIQSFNQAVSGIQSFNQAVSGTQSFNQSSSHIQSLPHMAASATTPTTSFQSPTSSFSAVSSPVVISSASFSAVVTTTTQSHQTTIMSTSHLASNQQCSVSTTNSYQPHLSVFSDASCLPLNADHHSQNISPGLLHNSNTSTLPTAGRSNSKERDPANVKTMIPIRIADCTLMLSLTPGEKERLENKLSQMSQKDQEEFLMHQQSLIHRSQQMQMEQRLKQQQQKQLLQLKQPQQHLQPTQDFQPQELLQQQQQPQKRTLQTAQHLSSPLPDQQQAQQLSHGRSYSPAIKLGHSAQMNSLPELVSPSAGQVSLGLPTTVQELMDKPEGEPQSCSVQKAVEQSQQLHHTPPHQQQQQQQMYSTLQQRTASLPQTCGSVQSFGIPQLGRCLAEQQLLRDRSLAVEPDVSTPFKSLSDAMRRLVRYHTLQDHKPGEGSKAHKIWDTRYSKLCDYLVRKKRCYIRRFHKMMLFQDMCQEKQPDYIQNLLCFNEQLRAVIDSEKQEAEDNPGLFDPTKSGLFRRNEAATCFETRTDDASYFKRTATESSVADYKHRHLAVKFNRSPDSDCDSDTGRYAQPPSLKRPAPDKGRTGMLKLVIKRRTIDNFIVKNSVEDVKALPRDLRPVVDVEKSDSEYEFDTSAADVSQNQPVIVRRRTLSLTSRQTSFDAGSDSDSASSHTEETVELLSEEEEEDLEEEREESDDDEEHEEKICNVDNDEFVDGQRKTEQVYHVSFPGDIDNNDMECDSDDSCSVDADALMETDERVPEQADQYLELSTTGALARPFSSTGHSTDIQNYHSKDRLSLSVAREVPAALDAVFNSNLSYSNSVQNGASCSDFKISVGESVDHRKFSFGSSADNAITRFCRSSQVPLPAEEEEEEEEYVADSPVSSLEKEAARTGLPNSSLFTTPNKNLLATDAMFNSDDEDDTRSSARLVSKFEIDNKDPQSSMIDESVRSVIDSVLNDDGDDDNHKGPQTNWAPSTHKLQSSTGHRNIFQFSASVLLPPSGREPNLDISVPSILKS